MKKLFYLLSSALLLSFVACGDDDDSPVYLDPDIVAGKWYMINLADSNVREFGNGKAGLMIYDRYSRALLSSESYGNYTITDSKIYFDVIRNGLEYRLNADSIWISENNRKRVRYVRIR